MSATQTIPFELSQFEAAIQKQCRYLNVESPQQFTLQQWYQAVSQAVLDLSYSVIKPLNSDKRHVNYLSMEFLIGRLTGNNLLSLGWYEQVRCYLQQYQIDLTDLLEEERDPALGNGGFRAFGGVLS